MTIPDEPQWTLDKRVPLALILAIVVQTGGALWWAASISGRVSVLEKSAATASDQAGRVIKVETQVDNLTSIIRRIEDKLDRALEHRQ